MRSCAPARAGKHPDGLAKGQGGGDGGGEADVLPTERINKALVTVLIITASH